MERKSSIHIEKGNLGYLFHNDRTKPTANSIFEDEKNEYMNNAKTALEIYRTELEKRAKKYTHRTGKKLPKNTITHLSAIVNLDERHKLEDVKKIADYLEESLGTKVFQIAVHRDEGYVDDETGEKHINYHAHLEFMGLDENGFSVRRKLNKLYLINLQSKVAEFLQMQRGINYTKERKKRPKRLDTYEYKEHAKRKAREVKELKKELAKVKDLKEENKKLRALLKELGATREDYAELEAFVKRLKEKIKNKELTKDNLENEIFKFRKKKEKELQKIEEEIKKEKTRLEEKKEFELEQDEELLKKIDNKEREEINELINKAYEIKQFDYIEQFNTEYYNKVLKDYYQEEQEDERRNKNEEDEEELEAFSIRIRERINNIRKRISEADRIEQEYKQADKELTIGISTSYWANRRLNQYSEIAERTVKAIHAIRGAIQTIKSGIRSIKDKILSATRRKSGMSR